MDRHSSGRPGRDRPQAKGQTQPQKKYQHQKYQEGQTVKDALTGEEVKVLRAVQPTNSRCSYAYTVKGKGMPYRAAECQLANAGKAETRRPSWDQDR